jgi:hypothetical protein
MINSFSGRFFFLSNFYIAPVEFDGLMYRNNEAAFQSAKILDVQSRRSVKIDGEVYDFTKMKPGESKSFGRMVALRNDWESVKDSIMYAVVLDKFTRNAKLAQMLAETNNQELVEGNTWNDTYWGVCNGLGKNMLGKTLMQVRDELLNHHQ